MFGPMRGIVLATCLLFTLGLSTPAVGARPSLVVVIVLDAFGSNAMARYGPHMRGGLRRMSQRGAHFQNGVHAIAGTITGAGHTNIVTGTWPNVHGVVSNKWWDPKDGSFIYCTDDPKHEKGPALIMAPTISDAIHVATHGRSRIVSLSIKDRTAVILGGHAADHVIWYDKATGQFKSSNYTPDPKWLGDMNLRVSAAPNFGKSWPRLRTDLPYDEIAGPDASPFEWKAPGVGNRFPHTLGSGLETANEDWFRSFPHTPQSSEALFELARAAIDAEQLGRRGTTDYVAIGVSSTDYLGHSYGFESQEYFDMLLRIDQQLGALMDHVDAQNGGQRTLWVVTGDHGLAPLPEKHPTTHRRVAEPRLLTVVNSALQKQGVKARVQDFYGPMLYLTHPSVGADRTKIRRIAADALAAHPSIAEAHPATQIADFQPQYRRQFENMAYPGRTPDVYFRVMPGHMVSGAPHGKGLGSNHGSPYVYDTHVPILISGPGVRSKTVFEPQEISRLVPTIAALLGVAPPAAASNAPLPALD